MLLAAAVWSCPASASEDFNEHSYCTSVIYESIDTISPIDIDPVASNERHQDPTLSCDFAF